MQEDKDNLISDFIHLINTESHIMWDVMVDSFNMTSDEQTKELNRMFRQLQTYFKEKKLKNIDYNSFRKVLNPCTTFYMYVFDSSMIDDICYGRDINSRLINLFTIRQNALFMFGDYIVDPKRGKILKSLFIDNKIDVSNWSNMTQYYLICTLGISTNMSEKINTEFKNDKSYCGYTDLTEDVNKLKSYLGMTIPQASIKISKYLFFSVPDGEEDIKDMNYSGFDMEAVSLNGLNLIPVPESLYLMFLTARPESMFMNQKEFDNTVKMFNPNFKYNDNYEINLIDEKIKYIEEHINVRIEKDHFKKQIREAINRFQIYHVRLISDNLIQFNIPIYHEIKKYVVALKWNFGKNIIEVITMVPSY